MRAMPSTNCSAVTHLVVGSSRGTCCGGATLASQPTLNFAVSTKIHCSLLLNWSADMFWKAWSARLRAQQAPRGREAGPRPRAPADLLVPEPAAVVMDDLTPRRLVVVVPAVLFGLHPVT